MSDEWIRASELSEYVYCRRSWYLRQVRGYASTNIRQMQAGTQFHQQHGQQVQKSVWLQRMAYALLFIVVALITFQLLMSASGSQF